LSNVDFRNLDGASQVSEKRAGSATRFALPIMGALAASGLLWMNWPSAKETSALSKEDEVFETSQMSVKNLPDEKPDEKKDNLIVVPVPEQPAPLQASDVNSVVQPGIDLEAQRAALEAQLAAEAARRKAEEDARLREEAARRAEEEAKRLAEAEKLRWERLRSEQIVVDGADKSNNGEAGTVNIAEDGQIMPNPAAGSVETDTNRAFLTSAENTTAGMVKATRNLRTDALIAQGTLIRGFLETAINTDLPGMVRAVVREDVYSLDGRRVLIPKGSRLVGEYNSSVSRGQSRVFIVWSRLIRSDGVSADIASPGADRLGRAGISGKVDRHFAARFGSAIMLSLLGGGAEYLAALGDTSSASSQTITTTNPVTGEVTTITLEPGKTEAEARKIAAERASSTLNEIATETFKETTKIPPTIHVAQGEPIIVFLRRDLDFSNLYADPVQQELARLKRGGTVRAAIDPTPLYLTPKDAGYLGASPAYYPPTPELLPNALNDK
jgi:type IV secretion system protein VirB10